MDDPEVLWSQSMREQELLPAVHAHLGSFPLRLRDNVLVQFQPCSDKDMCSARYVILSALIVAICSVVVNHVPWDRGKVVQT